MIKYELVGHGFAPKRHSISLVVCFLVIILLVVSLAVCFFLCNVWTLTGVVDSDEAKITAAFNEFAKEYKRDYQSKKELIKRKAIFAANLRKINEINSKVTTFTLGINEFADLTIEEFEALYKSRESVPDYILEKQKHGKMGASLTAEELADDDIDWVRDGFVNMPKYQGNCGSCWAFGTVSTVESLYAKRTGKLLTFSEQQLVDCCREFGCGDGHVEPGLECLAKTGISLDEEYPYIAERRECRIKEISKFYNVTTSYTVLMPFDTPEMQRQLHNTTMYVSVYGACFAFMFYKKGIITEYCPAKSGHGVQLVGSGVRDGIPYWKVRNSWGPRWGEGGYAYLLRNVTAPNPGICGIALHVVYPNFREK